VCLAHWFGRSLGIWMTISLEVLDVVEHLPVARQVCDTLLGPAEDFVYTSVTAP